MTFRTIYTDLRQRGMNCPCLRHEVQTMWWAFRLWYAQFIRRPRS